MANTGGKKLFINTNFLESTHNNHPFICATKDRENGSDIFIVASLRATALDKQKWQRLRAMCLQSLPLNYYMSNTADSDATPSRGSDTVLEAIKIWFVIGGHHPSFIIRFGRSHRFYLVASFSSLLLQSNNSSNCFFVCVHIIPYKYSFVKCIFEYFCAS
jgi:hypothetical protein